MTQHSTEQPLASTPPVDPAANQNLYDITRSPSRPLFEDELQALDSVIRGAKFPAALRYFLRVQRRHDIQNVPPLWWWPMSRTKSDLDDVYLEVEESGKVYPTPLPVHCFIKRGAWANPLLKQGTDLDLRAEAEITFVETLRIGASLNPQQSPIVPAFPQQDDVIQQGDVRFVVLEVFRPTQYFTTGAQPLVYGAVLKPIRPDSNIATAIPPLRTDRPEIPLWPV